MENCWDAKADGRPSFAEIKEQLCSISNPWATVKVHVDFYARFYPGARDDSDLYVVLGEDDD